VSLTKKYELEQLNCNFNCRKQSQFQNVKYLCSYAKWKLVSSRI